MTENAQNKKMLDIYIKYAEGSSSEEELDHANEQLKEILKSLGLRHRGVQIISCPSCARQGFDVINTVKELENRLSHIKTPVSYTHLTLPTNREV